MNYTTVLEYETAILAEIHLIGNAAERRTIQDLLTYAKDKEKEKEEAENRELRPRPDGTESAAYYRSQVDILALPTQSLQNLITGLLDLVESFEQQLESMNG